MNQNTIRNRVYRWTFWMADESPGPSQGDAAELIESLGFDPWSFSSLNLVSEIRWAEKYLTQFEVNGPPDKLGALRLAYERQTLCATAAPQPLPATVSSPEPS